MIVTQHHLAENSQKFIVGYAEHHIEPGRKILFEESKIVARIPYYHQWKVREAIQSIKQPNNLNRNRSYPLPSTWKEVINPLTRKSLNTP